MTAPLRIRTGSSELCSSLSLYYQKTTVKTTASTGTTALAPLTIRTGSSEASSSLSLYYRKTTTALHWVDGSAQDWWEGVDGELPVGLAGAAPRAPTQPLGHAAVSRHIPCMSQNNRSTLHRIVNGSTVTALTIRRCIRVSYDTTQYFEVYFV